MTSRLLPNAAATYFLLTILCVGTVSPHAAQLTRESVLAETLKPYAGASVRGVDTSTLSNKVMCGYQGWFNAEGDGAERGWVHWTKRRDPLGPGNAKIDLWPDVSELGAEERFATGFTNAAGRTLEVFSSFKQATVLRHFQWMRDYGIDGAFVQRFITDLRDPRALRHNNTVLAHGREGANRFGRAYAVMYDLSGLGPNRIQEVMDDWGALRTQMRVTDDPAYLRHRGRPLVAVWGVGFNDGRRYTLEECKRLVEFLKQDGCSVMLGVPSWFRELTRDSVSNSALHEVIALADVVSPWTVGRYRGTAEAKRHGERTWQPDIAWSAERKIDFLPVVFPGFSWFNMQGRQFDHMPRMKGEFLWSQFVAAKRAGATMIYVAMFDEVDEGTAIFKCTDDTPVSDTNRFLTYEGLPSDFYLRLTGNGAKLLRGELPVTEALPVATARAFPTYKRPVMTWVPPYAVGRSKARLEESFGGAGMKDALTHLGLQFWQPTKDGGLVRVGRTNEVNDAVITGLRNWGHTNSVRVLLCVYNAVGGKWDWPLARAGFAENQDKFIDALMAEVDRLQLDGVDVDLEGNGSFDGDKEVFVAFVRKLSERLHAQGKHLTVDTFSYKWNAPNQTWWKELLPHVDALTTMGYEEIGANAPEWRSYAFQKTAAGEHASKLMIGLPSGRNEWRGNSAMEHVQWLKADDEVGVSFWDAQVRANAWQKPEVWRTLVEIRTGRAE
ncbi:MAG TPA: glycosyl hydrolase family 18 protein [Methylomirabilota bacterium]|nr:glycosyl hydrolase family 18 protein [Methylomirabilota bacterium]